MEIKNIPVRIIDGYPDRVPTVTQWDAGQFLQILDSPLPPAVEFLFKNAKSDELLLVAGVTEEGITRVQIPNALLRDSYDITAYAVGREGESGKTLFRIDLDMQRRLPPMDIPTDPGDPYYLNGLEELIELTNQTVDMADDCAKRAETAATSAESHTEVALEAAASATRAAFRAAEVFAVTDNVLAAAKQAEDAAAAAAATADTLTPADTHYDPESWTAQSGVAVREAVWETLCNATDYTDEQLKNRVILAGEAPNGRTVGDFEGQLLFNTVGREIYIYKGLNVETQLHEWLRLSEGGDYLTADSVAHELNLQSEAPVSGKAFSHFTADKVVYTDSVFPELTNIGEAMTHYANEIIGMSFKLADVEGSAMSAYNSASGLSAELSALEARVAALEGK